MSADRRGERPSSPYGGNDNAMRSGDSVLPLHDAVSKRDIAKVRNWNEGKGDVRTEAFKQDRLGRTALHLLPYATDDGRMDVINDNTLAIARILIAAMGPDALNVSDHMGRTVLHYAAEAGDCSMLMLLASELTKGARDGEGEGGEKPGNGREVSNVQHSANVNGSTKGRTPLHLAALACCAEAARILIDDFGADAAAKDDDGRTPLHVLFVERAQDPRHWRAGPEPNLYEALVATARVLLDRMGKRINDKDNFGKTPVHFAGLTRAAPDFLKDVFLHIDSHTANNNGNRLLLDANVQDSYGRTPLHCTVMSRCYQASRILVEDFGADLSIRDKSSGETPLHMLATLALGEEGQTIVEREERAALARVIISKMDKDTVNAVDRSRNTAINIAARVGAFGFIIEMLSCSPLISPNSRDSVGRTVLHYAALRQKTEAARLLIEDFGVDAWVQDGEGRTALHFLIPHYVSTGFDFISEREAHQLRAVSSIARLMIENMKEEKSTTAIANDVAAAKAHGGGKVGPYTQDNQGDTALHLAAQAGAYHIMKVLFELAPAYCLSCRGAMGRSPLHCAASSGDLNSVRLLVDEFGADVAATDDDGNTPLHLSGSVFVTRFLIEAGADVTARNNDHQTPVHSSCERTSRDSREKLEVFLGLGIDVNVKDAKGRTPLHYCAMAGLLSSVAVLLDAKKGVVVNAVDSKGMTALDHALNASENREEYGSRIADMLVKNGGIKGAELLLLRST